MKEIKGLSKKEQEIYFTSLNRENYILRAKQLSQQFRISENYARKLLFGLANKNFAYRIMKGTYILKSPEMIVKKNFIRDIFQVMDQLLKKYYIGYQSAAYFYGAVEQIPFAIQVAVPKQKNNLMFGDTKIEFYQTKYFFGFERVKYGDQYVNVSDKEKTVLDCLMRYDLCGGLDGVKTIILNLVKEINEKKLLNYAGRIRQSSSKQRLGFILEKYFSNYFTKKFYFKLEKQIGNKSYLLDFTGKKKGKLNSRWRIIENVKL